MEKEITETNKTAGLVLGILSITLGVVSFFVFWWLSIVGLILGIIGVDISSSKILNITGISANSLSLLIFIIFLCIASAR